MTDQPAIPDKLFFTIREAAAHCGVKPHVLRYWEQQFPELAPAKSESGQRIYRREDIERLLRLKGLLYEEGFTIEGARKYLRREPAAADQQLLRELLDEVKAIGQLL